MARRGKGAASVARSYKGRNRVQRVGSARKTSARSQNAGLRLMVGARTGFDQTSSDHSLGARVG